MPVSVGYVRKVIPHPRHCWRQIPVAEWSTITQSTRFALENWDIVPRIEDGLVAAKTPFMLADNLSVLPKHNPRGVNLNLDGAASNPGIDAVLVPVKVDQAGPVDRDRLFTKPDERLLQRRQEGLFLLKHFPDRQVGVLRMPKLPGAFDHVLLQPGVQLI